MFGVLAGDIIGSRFEFCPTQETDVKFFHNACSWTDDTVCTFSVINTVNQINKSKLIPNNILFSSDLKNPTNEQIEYIKDLFFSDFTASVNSFPMAGYGKMFHNSIVKQEYGQSKGNGCLMRISPILFLCDNIDEAKEIVKICTITTHNSDESITAANLYTDIFFKIKNSILNPEFIHSLEQIENLKLEIKQILLNHNFDYKTIEEYHNNHKYEPLAITTLKICLAGFFEAKSFMDGIKHMLYVGGDTDTNSAILGALLELVYPITKNDLQEFEKYFNHKNHIIINKISKMYINSPITHKLYSESIDLITYYTELKPKDLTAEFDPLEMPSDEEYYQLERKIRPSFFTKILKMFKNT